MNYLYIGPEFPPNYKNFCIELHKKGINVFGIGEADFYEMPLELRSALKWYLKCNLNEIKDFDTTLDCLVYNIMTTNGWGNLDMCESHNEFWMRHEVYVNEKFNLDGIKTSDIELLKKKSLMKSKFKELGFQVAKGKIVKSILDCKPLISECGYPLILKPDEGVGAAQTYKINNEQELQVLLARVNKDFLLEEYINAPIVSFDGLCDYDSNIVYSSSLVYGYNVLDNIMGEDTFFYTDLEIPETLYQMGEKIVKAFKIKRKFFHIEFFKINEFKYIPLEINARPPGGPIIDMMDYSIENNLYAYYADMISNTLKSPSFNIIYKNKKYYCAYIGRKDKNYKHSDNEIKQYLRDKLMESEVNPPLFWEAMGKYKYIYRTTDLNELHTIKNYLLDIDIKKIQVA